MSYIVGESYLIKTLSFKNATPFKERTEDMPPFLDIPIFGEKHHDKELGQPVEHCHVDMRFVTEKQLREILKQTLISLKPNYDYPGLGLRMDNKFGTYSFKDKMLACLREWPNKIDAMKELQYLYIGKKLNPACMKCPHKETDLTNAPIIDGKIYCPAHGLNFDKKTLKCVGVIL